MLDFFAEALHLDGQIERFLFSGLAYALDFGGLCVLHCLFSLSASLVATELSLLDEFITFLQ